MSSGLVLFVILIMLLILRVPVFLALIISGSSAYIWSFSWTSWLHWVSFSPWSLVSKYHYSVIPLFLLMGQIASSGNITRDLFNFSENIGRKRRGGIAISTIISCAIFGSLCGSSLATAATMTPVSYKEMRKRNYSRNIILGTLAAGGTLGVLIPPSIVLVVYAIIAEQSIAHLSIAAIIPAILAFVGYIGAIKYYTYKYPSEIPKVSTKAKSNVSSLRAVLSPIAIFALFVVMLFGLYTGVFMPTEAASIGVVGVITIVIFSGNYHKLDWGSIFTETTKTTAIIMAIFIGAEIFNTALCALDFPEELCEFISEFKDYPIFIIITIIAILLLLGCFMDGIAIVLLVVPLILPIITTLNLGVHSENIGIWFGIIILIVVEIGLITPPFGMNLFVIRSLEPELATVKTLKSIKYFLVSDIVRIAILILIPNIMILP